LLAGQGFFAVLTGDASIRRRPMGRVVAPLREMGATIVGRRGGELAPLAVSGTPLRATTHVTHVASAQVKSSLLLAGLCAEGTTRVTEPRLSRDHTERMLRAWGCDCVQDGLSVMVRGRPTIGWKGPKEVRIPGDLSAAAFFAVGASIVPGSDVTITNVGVNPTRTGVLEVLGEMGARIEIFGQREQGGEPVADLRIHASPLHGVQIRPEKIPRTIDELPVLCIAAAFAQGDTVITGAEELRVKESDRIGAMASGLRAMGVSVREAPDGLTIRGSAGKPLIGAPCSSFGDHRVAMSFAMAGLHAEGLTDIDQADCIGTSFPGFQSKLSELLTQMSRPL
jgi:3-phosphoshikimate 1-carboxyvinyltransferase